MALGCLHQRHRLCVSVLTTFASGNLLTLV